MPQNGTITISNGTTSQNFDPKTVEGKVALYHDKTDAFVAGRPTVQLSISTRTTGIRVAKATLTVPRVVEEVLNGVTVPSVKDFSLAKAEVYVPKDWDSTDVVAVRNLMANLLLHATFAAISDDAEFVY